MPTATHHNFVIAVSYCVVVIVDVVNWTAHDGGRSPVPRTHTTFAVVIDTVSCQTQYTNIPSGMMTTGNDGHSSTAKYILIDLLLHVSSLQANIYQAEVNAYTSVV